jgi:hypothetical protein
VSALVPGTSASKPCPGEVESFAAAFQGVLDLPDMEPGALGGWLIACGVASEEQGGVTVAPIQSEDSEDLIVVARESAGDSMAARGALLVYHASADGYTLAHTGVGVGEVVLLGVEDLNTDDLVDIVWTDTTCGQHTCFTSLFVESWNGKTYEDWIVGEPTMAEPDFRFEEADAAGDGLEILVHGGVIGSAEAGPQRAWTETYASVGGEPYHLVGQEFDPTTCLYHQIIDANAAFADWMRNGFDTAIDMYLKAVEDKTLKACGKIDDELNTLRDFARFRLVVAYTASGDAGSADKVRTAMSNRALRGAADVFYGTYSATWSIVQAARDATNFAAKNPAAWEFMKDWGYANPGFTAGDLCPL